MRRWLLRTGAAWLTAATFVIPGIAKPTAPGPDVAAPGFYTDRTRIPCSTSAVIPFHLELPADRDLEWAPRIEPGDALDVLLPARVLKGESVGFLRVRALKPGQATLRIAGGTPIRVDVPKASASRVRPEIVTPAPGAFAWGEIAVGVEVDGEQDLPVLLRLPDGSTLEPAQVSDPGAGPPRRFLFSVDSTALDPGRVELAAVLGDAGGPASRPLPLEVVPPPGGDLVQGECESSVEGERPEVRGKKHPGAHESEDASGGRFVACPSSRPDWCVPFQADRPGLYQIVARVRGPIAGGEYPSVGVYLDEEKALLTGSRLAGPDWHRLPIGIPVPLEEGAHTLALRFMNDFHVKDRADRNLYLDTYEVLRVADLPPEPERGMVDGKRPDRPLAVAFKTPLHDRRVTGVINVRAQTWWDTKLDERPPAVTLRLNDRPLTTQCASAPVFDVWPGFLKEGSNTLQLVADHPALGRVTSVKQTVHAPAGGTACEIHRFTVRDRRWDDTMAPYLQKDDRGRYSDKAIFHTNGDIVTRLPREAVGRFDVVLDGRSEDFEGPAVVDVVLVTDEGERRVASSEMKSSWGQRHLGVVDLPPGPKRLKLSFVNDHYEKDRGDRNLHVRNLLLKSVLAGPDETPPRVKLLYPPASHSVYGADVVVAEVSDDRSVQRCDLVVDGELREWLLRPEDGFGPVVLPLLLRGLEPGPHEIAVEVRDAKGNRARSEPARVLVAGTAPDQPGAYVRAVRLLDRFAFGPEQRELAAVLTLGEETWLRDRLRRSYRAWGERAAAEYAAGAHHDEGNQSHIPLRALQQAVFTDNPARMRFVLWAQNHFSTYIRKTGAREKWQEHLQFSRLGAAPFPRLLAASATSPAMLVYLDQNTSYAGRLNENYAREIMELHTLGVDAGYTQEDVTALAHLLTGWTASETVPHSGRVTALTKLFRFDPTLNDGEAGTVFGMSFPAAEAGEARERVEIALEMLSGHPRTAAFVCGKLAEHYTGLPAPERLTADLANTYLRTGGDLEAVLMDMARHPSFWDPGLPAKFTTPLDFSVRLARAARYGNTYRIRDFLRGAGMGLFERSTPDGYQEEPSAYADTNALLQRWRLTRDLEVSLANRLPPAARSRLEKAGEEGAQEVIDLAALHLTGLLLGSVSNQAALDVLAATEGRADQRIRRITGFVGQLPEANLR